KPAECELRAAGPALLGSFQEHAQARRTDVLEAGKVQNHPWLALNLLDQHLVQIFGGVAVQTPLNRKDQNLAVDRFTNLHRAFPSCPSARRTVLRQRLSKAKPISPIFPPIAKIIHERTQKMHTQSTDRAAFQGRINIRWGHFERVKGPPIVLYFHVESFGLTPQRYSDLPVSSIGVIAVADDICHQFVQNEVQVVGSLERDLLAFTEAIDEKSKALNLREIVAQYDIQGAFCHFDHDAPRPRSGDNSTAASVRRSANRQPCSLTLQKKQLIACAGLRGRSCWARR